MGSVAAFILSASVWGISLQLLLIPVLTGVLGLIAGFFAHRYFVDTIRPHEVRAPSLGWEFPGIQELLRQGWTHSATRQFGYQAIAIPRDESFAGSYLDLDEMCLFCGEKKGSRQASEAYEVDTTAGYQKATVTAVLTRCDRCKVAHEDRGFPFLATIAGVGAVGGIGLHIYWWSESPGRSVWELVRMLPLAGLVRAGVTLLAVGIIEVFREALRDWFG